MTTHIVRVALLTATLASLLLPPRPAAADSQQARLDYLLEEDLQGCPDASAMRRAVTARLGYDPFSDSADSTIAVEIHRSGSELRARVYWRGESGEPRGMRELQSASGSCEELAAAAALAVSIAIDPVAAEATETTAEAPAVAAPETTIEAGPAAGKPGSMPRWMWLAGGGVFVGRGMTPGWWPGLELGVGARRGWLAFEVWLSAMPPHSFDVEGGSIDVQWLAVTANACVARGGLRACLLASGGALRGTGREPLENRQKTTTPYAGAGGRIAWDLRLRGRLSLRVHADVAATLARTSYTVSGEDVWTQPAVATELGVLGIVGF